MSLDKAIELLETEISALGQGKKDQPKEGTPEWYVLRAKGVGLTFLRHAKANGRDASNPEFQRFYRKFSKEVKAPSPLDVPADVLQPEPPVDEVQPPL